MKQTITKHANGEVSITWEAETDQEGVELKDALLDALNERTLRANEPDDYDPDFDEQEQRAALDGSVLDEAAAPGGPHA